MKTPDLMITDRYYAEFKDKTFVVQAEGEAVEKSQVMVDILAGIKELLAHGIRVVLVFGKDIRFEERLRTGVGARRHPETNRLIISEAALPHIREERTRIARVIASLCQSHDIPYSVLPETVIRAERRIAHGSTGVVAGLDSPRIQAVLNQPKLAIIGFGGVDDRGHFLHVPSVSLASELAVELKAQKLLHLMHSDGILLPDLRGRRRQLSFADFEELLCLLQRKDRNGNMVLSDTVVPRIHTSIRAVAGGVDQVHLVSYSRLLDEILTRNGVGTMIERQQSHHVDYARPEDLDEIERLHIEAQRYTTECGTSYVKPLARFELERLLGDTLLLKHRGVLIGKLHATEMPGSPGSLQIGGFAVAENHHDSQQGQVLLLEALDRLLRGKHTTAIAITASQRARRLFSRCGGSMNATEGWRALCMANAIERYAPQERGQVQTFEFSRDDTI